MIVKMVQNFGNKMEVQINRLEAQIKYTRNVSQRCRRIKE